MITASNFVGCSTEAVIVQRMALTSDKDLDWSRVTSTSGSFVRLVRTLRMTAPRTLVLAAELRTIIQRRFEDKRFDCSFVFHCNGKHIKALRPLLSISSEVRQTGKINPARSQAVSSTQLTIAALGEL